MKNLNESEHKGAKELKAEKVPIPNDFEKGVVVRTFLSQLPVVSAPLSFEDNVMMQIGAIAEGEPVQTKGKRGYALAAGGAALTCIVAAGIWYFGNNNSIETNPAPTPIIIQEAPATQSPNNTSVESKTMNNTIGKKDVKEQRKNNQTLQRKNDSASPVPGFKTHSTGEHEED